MKTMAILNSPMDGTLMDSDLHAQAYVTSDKLLDVFFFFWGGGSNLD